MKKEFWTTDQSPDPVNTASVPYPTVGEIEQFVIDAGSDNVPTFGGRYEGGIHIQQIPDEIAPAIHAILESGQKIETYLEIGVAAGGTTVLFNHFLHPGKVVLVDDGAHWKASLREGILTDVPHTFIRGNSYSSEVAGKVAEVCPDYDLIIVDAGHAYDAVKADVEMYLPMLRKGGFLVLHDSALPEWGVMRVVQELRDAGELTFVGEYVTRMTVRPCGVALFRGDA